MRRWVVVGQLVSCNSYMSDRYRERRRLVVVVDELMRAGVRLQQEACGLALYKWQVLYMEIELRYERLDWKTRFFIPVIVKRRESP